MRIFPQIEDTIDPWVTAVLADLNALNMVGVFVVDRAISLEKLLMGKGRA